MIRFFDSVHSNLGSDTRPLYFTRHHNCGKINRLLKVEIELGANWHLNWIFEGTLGNRQYPSIDCRQSLTHFYIHFNIFIKNLKNSWPRMPPNESQTKPKKKKKLCQPIKLELNYKRPYCLNNKSSVDHKTAQIKYMGKINATLRSWKKLASIRILQHTSKGEHVTSR